MTEALCLHCGTIKFGAICPCGECGVASSGDMELDIAFSDHCVSADTLIRFGTVIRKIRTTCANEEIVAWSFLAYVSVHYPALGYPFNRSIPTPFSMGGSLVAAPSSAGAHARVAVLAGLSAADGWR